MAINPDAVGESTPAVHTTWGSTECILYALGVGAGMTDPAGSELEFTTENSDGVTQRALPTMCVIRGPGVGGPSPLDRIGEFNPALLVHGEQALTLHEPLPVEADFEVTSRVSGIYDKGKAALVVLESEATNAADGSPAFTLESSMFIRGEGGWGGERGPAKEGPPARPERDADHAVTYETRRDQALLYRLSGDRNPLHSDPAFAELAGFDRPILHGLCTYGFTGRALLHTLCGSDPDRFRSMAARFSAPVMPGDTLDVRIWQGDGEAWFTTSVGDTVVVDGGYCTFS